MHPPEGHGTPHEPASSAPRRLIPERPMLVHGLALLALAVAAIAGLGGAAYKAAWFGLLLAPPFLLAATLAGWSAAIHLTGGERFDDHPCV